MTRNIDAPGIELREYDRSQYNRKTDYSLPRAPVCFICGFADKGENYTVQWINTKNTLLDYYGSPTNEAEKYFYNGAIEILNKGGICLMSRLPYYNRQLNNYSYNDYVVDGISYISSDQQVSQLTSQLFSDKIIDKYNKLSNFERVYTSKFIKDSIEFACEKNIQNDNVKQVVLSARTIYDKTFENLSGTYCKAGRCLSTYNNLFNFPLSGVISKHEAYDLSDTQQWNAIENDKDVSGMINVSSMFQTYLCCYTSSSNDYVGNIQRDFYSSVSSQLGIQEISSYIVSSMSSEYREDVEDFYSQKAKIENDATYNEIWSVDQTITSFVEIKNRPLDIQLKKPLISLKELDSLLINAKQLEQNQIKIVDITHSEYESTPINVGVDIVEKECLGIAAVLVSPMNAMFFQELINAKNTTIDDIEITTNLSNYNNVSQFFFRNITLSGNSSEIMSFDNLSNDNLATQLSSNTIYESTLSRETSKLFPLLNYTTRGFIDRKYLKQIGVVVLQAFKDTANDDLVNFKLLESFVGSFDRNAIDEISNKSIFIDKIINESSKYIRFFSNVSIPSNATTMLVKNQSVVSLGFNSLESQKNIDVNVSILDALNIIFKKANNPNTVPLDIVIDAGVSNIAQFVSNKKKAPIPKDYVWKITDYSGSNSEWNKVLNKYDEFCKNTRHDCLFLADGLRPFCVIGNQKIVRSSDINSTIKNDILPNLKYMVGLNSSFSAGYCDWFYQQDEYSKDFFWIPPSIKAAGVMVYCDTYCQKWSAPAGHTRGVIQDVYDCAFSPTIEEAGKIYNARWNYAINYPVDGIILEGQKTMQVEMTALDRINVRRLLLYLEKTTIRLGRRFLYEGNTAYLRQKFVDTLTPIFKDCQQNDGIRDFAIKCDDDNNTDETIGRNELHCRIAVKPVKVLEFLVLDFIVTNQTASVNEEVLR